MLLHSSRQRSRYQSYSAKPTCFHGKTVDSGRAWVGSDDYNPRGGGFPVHSHKGVSTFQQDRTYTKCTQIQENGCKNLVGGKGITLRTTIVSILRYTSILTGTECYRMITII